MSASVSLQWEDTSPTSLAERGLASAIAIGIGWKQE